MLNNLRNPNLNEEACTRDVLERTILGSILIDPGMLPDVADHLSPELFSNALYREIYLTIDELMLADEIVDSVTVYMQVKCRNNLNVDENRLKHCLQELTDSVIFASKKIVIEFAEEIRNER